MQTVSPTHFDRVVLNSKAIAIAIKTSTAQAASQSVQKSQDLSVVKQPVSQYRTITFDNQGDYVASMVVMYFEDQVVCGRKISVPKVENTGNLAIGITRSITIPQIVSEGTHVKVFLKGVGTINNNFYDQLLSTDFKHQICIKSSGSIFNPQGAVVVYD